MTTPGVYLIADPIVRFHHLVTRRHLALLEERRADEVWSRSVATYRSNVVGPHFESICRHWVNRYASAETLGGLISPAHRLQINDRDRHRSFKLRLRVFVGFGLLWSVWGSCYKEAAGCVVGVVGESVGDAS